MADLSICFKSFRLPETEDFSYLRQLGFKILQDMPIRPNVAIILKILEQIILEKHYKYVVQRLKTQ